MAFDVGGRLGTVFVELDLDRTKFEAGQRRIVDESKKMSKTVERSFQILKTTSNEMYQAMANQAILAYKKIETSAKTSINEQVKAHHTMVARINALNIQKVQDPLFDFFGVKSQKMFEAQRHAILSNYKTLYNSIKVEGHGTAKDLINIEKNKNRMLKELNNEMALQHKYTAAAMVRDVLRLYAAYYVLKTGAEAFFRVITSGMKAIDDMKIATVGVAAQITTMQGTTGNIAENYKKNLEYARALVPVLMEIDANSLANYELLQRMNMAMTGQGVILDVNNKKHIESFTALSNAIAMYTAGQDQNKQAAQEIRAIMSGQVREGALVAKQLDAAIKRQKEYKGGLKELVAEGQKHNDTLERLSPYLIGIVEASGDIQNTWQSVTTSLKTAWGIIQRGMFADLYEDLTTNGKKATEWMKDNAGIITNIFKTIGTGIKFIFNAIFKGLYGQTVLILVPIKKLPDLIVKGYKSIQIIATNTIYALADLMAWFIKTIEMRKEDLRKVALAAKAIFTTDTIANVEYESNLRRAAIEKQYELEKQLRRKDRDEMIRQIEENNKNINKVTIPEFPPITEKESKKIFTSRMNMYKKLYDMEIQHIDHLTKLRILSGENEFNFIFESLNKKEAALNKEYNLQKEAITNYVDNIKERNAQLELLEADYTEKLRSYAYQREELAIKVDNAIKTSTGQMYMDINRYSKESMDYQIAQIERKARQSLITTTDVRTGNEVVVARWESNQILKIREERNKAIISAELEMLNEINANSVEATDLQIKLWEYEANEYIRLADDKVKAAFIAHEWLQNKIDRLNQNYLKDSMNFYSELTGYEKKYRSLKLEWIEKESNRLAKLYNDDVAAAQWAQQEKLKLDEELSKRVDETTGLIGGSYFPTYYVDNIKFKTGKEADEYIAKKKEAEEEAKRATENARKATENAVKEAQKLAEEAARKAEEIAKQKFGLEIELLELLGKKEEALAAKREAELNAMDESLHKLQSLIWTLNDLKTTISNMISDLTSDIDEQITLSRDIAQNSRQTAEQYKQIIESLESSIKKTKGVIGLDDAQRRLNTIFSLAMTGEQTALKELPLAIEEMLSASLKSAKSAEDYARDQGKALLQLSKAKEVSTSRINWEEYQATLLETQTTLLEEIKDNLGTESPNAELLNKQKIMLGSINDLLKIGNELSDEQKADLVTGNATQDVIKNLLDKNVYYSEQALTELVENNGNQLAKLTDIVNTNYTIIDAINALTSVMAEWGDLIANPPVAPEPTTPTPTTPPSPSAPTVVDTVITSPAQTIPSYTNRYTSYSSIPSEYLSYASYSPLMFSDYDWLVDKPETYEPAHGYILYSDGSKTYFARGGDFEGGYRVVGEEGPELEFTGPSHILSHEKSKSLFDVSRIVEELKQLRTEIKNRDEEKLKYTSRMSKIIDGFDVVGLPPERT